MPAHAPALRIRDLLRSGAVFLLISLVATEILLRVADFRALRQDESERSLAYGYDAELGWVPSTNSVSTVTTARTIHAQHNSLGFRDVEFQPDGRPVVLFIGDSFVSGVGAEAGERFTDLLRNRLLQFQIVNAGVSGQGPIRNISGCSGYGAASVRKSSRCSSARTMTDWTTSPTWVTAAIASPISTPHQTARSP
jgi:hypothetical protein